MRWTRAALLTRRADLRTAKSCGPDASTPASSWRKKFPRGDGDKKARSPGRARNKLLKPSRAGMPGDPGATVVTNACALLHFAHAAAGAMGTRHSPRPLWADRSCTTRAQCAARRRSVSGCHRPRKRAIQFPSRDARMLRFAIRCASDGSPMVSRLCVCTSRSPDDDRDIRAQHRFVPGCRSRSFAATKLRCSAPQRERFCSKKFSAVLANTCMLASRSGLPVSSVIADGSRPAIAMQLWPAASP